jgi:protein subunit release factor B
MVNSGINNKSQIANRKSAIENLKSGETIMSTKAQTKANQQNAQKSTGPKTAEGKAVVSQNAVKHGLFAAEAVITGKIRLIMKLITTNFSPN